MTTYNINTLTIRQGKTVSKYRTLHAFKTAWLNSRIISERLDYVGYSRRWLKIAKKG